MYVYVYMYVRTYNALWNPIHITPNERNIVKPYETLMEPYGAISYGTLRSPMEPHEILWSPIIPSGMHEPYGSLQSPMDVLKVKGWA